MINKFDEKLRRYAEIAVKIGVNLQKGQKLLIMSSIETADFARMIEEEAYKCGGADVDVLWSDEKFNRIRLENTSVEDLHVQPKHMALQLETAAERGDAVLSISSKNPEIFKGLDIKKIAARRKALDLATDRYYDFVTKNLIAWNIVAVPNPDWAKLVFPDDDVDTAIEKLWNAIFKAVRIEDDNDSVAEWEAHDKLLKEKAKFLNEHQFVKMIYKNSIGTDLEVGMPEHHIWAGGSGKNAKQVDFMANMPTEEVFSMPHKDRVNGRIKAALPLNYDGTLIKGIDLTFKDGKVVDFSAEEGYEALKALLNIDEGAKQLGEIALVPTNSPICEMGTLFLMTLFDENAACHFALGEAYPECIEGGLEMDEKQLMAHGANVSFTHVDFMVGTSDLSIVGITKEGKNIQVFKDGKWAF